jgi:hypothetical protein
MAEGPLWTDTSMITATNADLGVAAGGSCRSPSTAHNPDAEI